MIDIQIEISNAGQGFFRNIAGETVGLFDKGMWDSFLIGHWFYVKRDWSNNENVNPKMKGASNCLLSYMIKKLLEDGFEYIGYNP